MSILAIILGFTIIIILNSRKIDMSICLLAGSITTGIITGLKINKIMLLLIKTTKDSMTIRLMIIIAVISGLGYLLRENNDLQIMITSLYKLISNYKILSMTIPAIIGTLAVPGGAILSAPMIKESTDKIKLSGAQKTSINIFYRHIIFFVYPLYNSIIMTSELFSVSKYSIIKYNLLIITVGLISAYYSFFNRDNNNNVSNKKNENESNKANIIAFISSFSPIMSILLLAIVFNFPFQYSVFAGLFIGAGRNLQGDNKILLYWQRIKDFFIKGVNYKLIILIFSIMFFKSVVETSGAVEVIAGLLAKSGIPLILMIVSMGLVTGYLTGLNIAALGILIPIFIPLFPAENSVPYISLLFTSSFTGYLISPLHMCFLLTKEYFNTNLLDTYKYLIIPLVFMILTGILQVVFTL